MILTANQFLIAITHDIFFLIQLYFIVSIFLEFSIIIFYTALCIAADKKNIEIVKLLLSFDNIDVNIQNILIILCLINFDLKFQLYYRLHYFMEV